MSKISSIEIMSWCYPRQDHQLARRALAAALAGREMPAGVRLVRQAQDLYFTWAAGSCLLFIRLH